MYWIITEPGFNRYFALGMEGLILESQTGSLQISECWILTSMHRSHCKHLCVSTYNTKNKRQVSFGLFISFFPHVRKQFPLFF